jgi:hypothetical protein
MEPGFGTKASRNAQFLPVAACAPPLNLTIFSAPYKSPRQAKKAPQEPPQIPGDGHRSAEMQLGIPKKH